MAQSIREWRNVDAEVFRSVIAPLGQPAVLRGLVAHWPAVSEARESAHALCDYLISDNGAMPVQTLIGAPEVEGRLFYSEDMKGMNFERRPETLTISLTRLLAHIDDTRPPALAVQSAAINLALPRFCAENHTPPLVDASALPRIWIGNAISVQTHFDLFENIACVVAGRRRFTLFPPEQIANMYVGPIDFTPAGAPVSLASLNDPDFVAHPRFEQALAEASTADLEPGDAIFIPYHWWHHVGSLSSFNVLVNYWWDETQPAAAPTAALAFALLALRPLPPRHRAVWRAVFEHYIFDANNDPVAHIPMEAHGILGDLAPEKVQRLKAMLMEALSR